MDYSYDDETGVYVEHTKKPNAGNIIPNQYSLGPCVDETLVYLNGEPMYNNVDDNTVGFYSKSDLEPISKESCPVVKDSERFDYYQEQAATTAMYPKELGL